MGFNPHFNQTPLVLNPINYYSIHFPSIIFPNVSDTFNCWFSVYCMLLQALLRQGNPSFDVLEVFLALRGSLWISHCVHYQMTMTDTAFPPKKSITYTNIWLGVFNKTIFVSLSKYNAIGS